jgi:hypothetical protein
LTCSGAGGYVEVVVAVGPEMDAVAGLVFPAADEGLEFASHSGDEGGSGHAGFVGSTPGFPSLLAINFNHWLFVGIGKFVVLHPAFWEFFDAKFLQSNEEFGPQILVEYSMTVWAQWYAVALQI